MIEIQREDFNVSKKVQREQYLEIYYTGSIENVKAMTTNLNDPIDSTPRLKLQQQVADLDLPQRRKRDDTLDVRRRRKRVCRRAHVKISGERTLWQNPSYTRRNTAVMEDSLKIDGCGVERCKH